MLDEDAVRTAMSIASEGDEERLGAMMESMSEETRMYFKGYVAGYVEAVRHLQEAGSLEVYMDSMNRSGNGRG